MSDFVVVGAGVIGLTTALVLAEEYSTRKRISIVAENSPESLPYAVEYTSPWAGAHFRPFPSKNEHELREYPYARVTFDKLKQVAERYPESSVKFVKGREYFECPDEHYRNLATGYKEGLSNFRILDGSELPTGCEMGTEYDSFVLNAPVYLQFLYRLLIFQHRVKFVHAKLDKLREATKYGVENAIIINCSGRGLQWEGGYDTACFPIRGQTLLINAPHNGHIENFTVTHQSKDGLWTFYIPRPLHGGIILGGTKQPNDTFAGVRASDSEALMHRAAHLFPDLMREDSAGNRYFEVVRTNVGFRPARKGGVNVSEIAHDKHRVIHAYGCGGSGYEFSYGLATEVLTLVKAKDSKL